MLAMPEPLQEPSIEAGAAWAVPSIVPSTRADKKNEACAHGALLEFGHVETGQERSREWGS